MRIDIAVISFLQQFIMALFFTFENNQHNLLLYFFISTIVLYLGPEFFVPSMSPSKGVPIITTPMGRIKGVKMSSRDGREIYSYRSKLITLINQKEYFELKG